MAGQAKQRLSAMLDVDLEQADTLASDLLRAQKTSDGRTGPGTFAEWFQVAPKEDLRDCLKRLVAERNDVHDEVETYLKEEREHQAWVQREEEAWKADQKNAVQEQPEKGLAPQSDDGAEETQLINSESSQGGGVSPKHLLPDVDVRSIAIHVPLRLSSDERSLLGILEGALYVSEYTDRVDVYHTGSKARRMALQIQQLCAILAGLVVANNLDVARKPLTERGFAEQQHFFRAVFEIGRRYKILNPDKLRDNYGKLIHLLQDSVKDEVAGLVGFECVSSVRTVWTMLKSKRRGEELMRDPLLLAATREIYEGSKTRAEIQTEVSQKREALAALRRKYAEAPEVQKQAQRPTATGGHLAQLLQNRKVETEALTEEDVDLIAASIGDHFAFQRYNREPVERIIEYLKKKFNPSSEGKWSLEIRRGMGGSCLSHSHRTQYTFVLQSLLLWREIMGNMFTLWLGTEGDLLDPGSRYRLCDTGQGLNRMQSAPRVSKMMKQILGKVQSEVGGWVGLSVVHLGDRDVPNALVFIDKYTQVPRILAPIVRTLDRLPEVYQSTPALTALIDREFGGVEALEMTILQDFFRHGFDGSGDDGGSCVDGRLTSCWNWCSKIEKKKYFPALLLTGFNGFDG